MMKTAIQIVQTKENIEMRMDISETYFIRNVFLENTYTKERKMYSVIKEESSFVLQLNQKEFLRDLLGGKMDTIRDMDILSNVEEVEVESTSSSEENGIDIIVETENERNERKGLWYWYAEILVNIENAPEELLEKLRIMVEEQVEERSDNGWVREDSTFKRNIRLGKFKNTEVEGLQEMSIKEHTLLTYINGYGYLVTAVDEKVSGKTKIQVEQLKTTKDTVKVQGRLNSGYFSLNDCRAVLKSRTTINEHYVDVVMSRNEEVFNSKFGKNIYLFDIEINFNNLLGYREDIYDLFIEVSIPFSQNPVRIRVGRPTFRAKHFFGELAGESEQGILLVNPYYTLYKANLSFEVFPFLKENYRYLKKARRFSRLKQFLNRKKDVWLVGERPYKAQDTGYHFFKYMRENHPEKNVYYVIQKDSPEYANVAPLGNVLEFGSIEHIKNVIIATKILSSHHANYLFPLRTKSFSKIIRASRVFLQHGVMGVKNMNNLYGVDSSTFNADLFITSSNYEKGYITRDFGYKKNEVAVTGLSRFDALFTKDMPLKKQVLIIPTWRDWIQNIESFLESEYYERYSSLINNEELLKHSKANGYEVVFCLHPNMQIFSSYFDNPNVKIIYQGEVDVQRLIKESALMITDYSSVAFDFSFLHKPVIYYQFDMLRFIGKRGSHIDMYNDLPGDIVHEEHALVDTLKSYVDTGFVMKDVYKEKANKFIAYKDQNASKRIYEAATNFEKKTDIIKVIKDNELLLDVYRKFRRSKYYFPVMKKVYSLMKTFLPVDEKKVFFESGIGKNFADSPKEIFETLQQENKDLHYVWSYNKTLSKNYNNTKVIKRLSPSYYYHLATAKYWVNNQNFPTYIKKRKGTDYLQTWHGTPLKRMLHDIEEIQGRDETYLSRVSDAVKNWDYLVSPSKYASDNFKTAFQYTGPILEVGYPRNDIFYREDSKLKAEELKARLNIDPSKKVILYAMTFRDNQTKGKKFTLDIPLDFQKFHERFGDEYVLLVRLHVVISKKLKIPAEYKESVKNVSAYPDIQELMLLSDVLITDYSSVFFDFLNTDKPILFYTYDLEEYRDKLRGFYLDFENEAPGPLCLEEDLLYDAIENIDQVKETYKETYQSAKNRFCYLDDGQAAKRIVDRVFK
ncbi:CDP-glycerol glycerophosphotransferase family protein [Planococcus sp. N028]|uniref:CDP-glycerol glycerophosphotransferase family protein n=1 Tax=Planococcus shixiaomingii TaxID=3058393 RepID=A0ABT8N1H3_9BACL|nr:CDP-glycerol glycerophosphotransferase family protein [Planococcus sp. N028]MDN7241742.1 CDP-glycerol glycerophosphotransferase family protein [Planococcus sp. N028]